VSTVTYADSDQRDIESCVPALQNDDVTGMTEEKQDEAGQRSETSE
jgi:hypothetical protein